MALQRHMRIADGSGTAQDNNGSYLRVGFATNDMLHANQHFGSAKNLVIYEVNPNSSHLVEVAEFSYVNHDENEGKLGEKIALLKGCIAIYSQAVGSSAAQKLLAAGIQPVKVHDEAEISALIAFLQDEMLKGPSAWLAQAINRQKNPELDRFEGMEAESWDE